MRIYVRVELNNGREFELPVDEAAWVLPHESGAEQIQILLRWQEWIDRMIQQHEGIHKVKPAGKLPG